MRRIFILIALLFALISCGEKTTANNEKADSQAKKQEVINVTVSIPPQAFIIKSVGKDKVKVNVMLPPSSAPETYEPGPQKMADLKDSTVYFKGGLPFEGFFLERLAKDYKNVRFADMMKGINFRKMEGHFHHHHHSEPKAENKEDCGEDACAVPGLEAPKAEEAKHEHHHHDGEHHHEGKHEDCPHYKEHHPEMMPTEEEHHHHHGKPPFPPMPGHFPEMHDPHVWLDPMNLIVMTDNTVAELSEVDPDNAAFYRENGEALKAEIKKVNDEVAAQLKDVEGKSFVVHHPAFGYFAERFGLKQVPLEIEGKEPGAVDMAKVVDFIKKNNAKAVFMQAQIPDSVIKSVAEETKVRVITLDPLKENVLENIKETASEIKGALIDEK
ncbi:zinc ABC transporter substrate-binding protein [bacterium]|nr:zinc ABC transporter substrate-binding protein [bacterium]